MALQNTNLLILGSHLPATFRGTPDDLFMAMLERMRIVSPSGTSFFVVSDVEPSSNVGPWLKGGTQWWVWDEQLKRYAPLDISASTGLLFRFQATTPTEAVPPIWLKTDADPSEANPFPGPVSWNVWNGSVWVDFTSFKDRSVTQEKLAYTANFFGVTSGVNNYAVSFDPVSAFNYGNGNNEAFACYVKFSNANTTAVTLSVNGGGGAPVRKNGGTTELIAGEITAGSVHLLVFDGTQFQIESPLAALPTTVHGVPVFLGTAVTIYSGGPVGWTVYNNLLADGVPADASAIILQSVVNGGGTAYFRKIAGAQEHFLGTATQINQGTYPIATQTFSGLGFNFKLETMGTLDLQLVGYIT